MNRERRTGVRSTVPLLRRPPHAARRTPRGFTLTELLTGMTVTVLTLTGIMNLFLLGSKHLRDRQDTAVVENNLRMAMQQIVNEVHWAVTANPTASGAGAGARDFSLLPKLPYKCIRLEFCPVVETSSPVLPADPALGHFPLQSGVDSKYFKWYPNPLALSSPTDPRSNQGESNYMAFYKVDRGVYHRITFMLDDSNPDDQMLVKIDRPFHPVTLQPGPDLQMVLVHQVRNVQFTYPLLMQEMNTNANFEGTLISMNQNDQETFLNQKYRKVVDIRLSCYVPHWRKLANGQTILDTAKSAIREERSQVSVRN